MPPSPKQKLYCYVDETGQDTEGRIFLVAVVILESERDQLRDELAEIERASGKRERKWTRATLAQREAYVRGLLSHPSFARAFYYSAYEETRAYVDLTVLSVAKAINTHTPDPYAATFLVDGLRRTEQHRFASGLRKLRVSVRKMRGVSDENDAFIRLADALAGFVRDSRAGGRRLAPLYAEAIKKGAIREI
jgi:hypothetical protein